MVFQWHITEKCNLSCTHCYQENISEEVDLEGMKYILDEITSFAEDRKCKIHLNITGGEPLLNKAFFPLVKLLEEKNISFGVLTNGTLLDEEACGKLGSAKFVQVSIEGGEATHNRIRGKNNLEKVLKGVKLLKKRGLRVLVSFTANRNNYREFPEVCKLARKHKVDRVWADRLVPSGRGKALEPLNPEETYEFFNIMKREKERKALFSKTEVYMGRALQFLQGGEVYRCSAGKELLALMPNGEIYPCRRMPIPCGNIFKKSLGDILRGEVCSSLRNEKNIKNCENCIYLKMCGGGLRCVTYALEGTPFVKDCGCYLEDR